MGGPGIGAVDKPGRPATKMRGLGSGPCQGDAHVAGMTITLGQLKAAMQRGGSLDGHPRVLGYSGPGFVEAPFRRPIILAGFQSERLTATRSGIPSSLSVRDFETLSLAARVALLDSKKAEFEPQSAIDALVDEAEKLDVDLNAFPVVEAEDICEALAWAAALLEPGRDLGWLSGDPAARQRLNAGLQLVGCRIQDTRRSNCNRGMSFAGAKLPFSLRLVGCVIECPLRLTGAELGTLDLAGSAMVGLDASFLNASGSIRMRRTMVLAPVEFGGARVRGVFDGADCLVGPRLSEPTFQAFDPDRGMLNLSQARIENDVILDRARIWGGLSLRGAETQRSIFMNDVFLAAPVAILERMALDIAIKREADRSGEKTGDDIQGELEGEIKKQHPACRSVQRDDPAELAETRLHEPCLPPPTQRGDPSGETDCPTAARINCETVAGLPWRETKLLRELLSHSMRNRTSAMRADGLKVAGSVFARGLKANGRVRLKYSTIAGGLHLDGATLRSVQAVGSALDALKEMYSKDPDLEGIFSLRFKTRSAAQLTEGAGDDQYALDVRECKIGGDLSLGSIGSKERFSKIKEMTNSIENWGKCETAYRKIIEQDYNAASFDGQIMISGSLIGSSLLCKRLRDVRGPPSEQNDPGYAIEMINSKIDQDVDFRESEGIHGIDMSFSEIGGSILFANKTKPQEESSET